MKRLLYAVGALLGVAVLAFVVQGVASETGEVVVLTAQDGEGERQTRLWVVDLHGLQYLRARPTSGWYRPLRDHPDVTLSRAGQTRRYRVETRMEAAGELNRLMREKYGWRDAYVALLVGGREDAVPVALIPAG